MVVGKAEVESIEAVRVMSRWAADSIGIDC